MSPHNVRLRPGEVHSQGETQAITLAASLVTLARTSDLVRDWDASLEQFYNNLKNGIHKSQGVLKHLSRYIKTLMAGFHLSLINRSASAGQRNFQSDALGLLRISKLPGSACGTQVAIALRLAKRNLLALQNLFGGRWKLRVLTGYNGGLFFGLAEIRSISKRGRVIGPTGGVIFPVLTGGDLFGETGWSRPEVSRGTPWFHTGSSLWEEPRLWGRHTILGQKGGGPPRCITKCLPRPQRFESKEARHFEREPQLSSGVLYTEKPFPSEGKGY